MNILTYKKKRARIAWKRFFFFLKVHWFYYEWTIIHDFGSYDYYYHGSNVQLKRFYVQQYFIIKTYLPIRITAVDWESFFLWGFCTHQDFVYRTKVTRRSTRTRSSMWTSLTRTIKIRSFTTKDTRPRFPIMPPK